MVFRTRTSQNVYFKRQKRGKWKHPIDLLLINLKMYYVEALGNLLFKKIYSKLEKEKKISLYYANIIRDYQVFKLPVQTNWRVRNMLTRILKSYSSISPLPAPPVIVVLPYYVAWSSNVNENWRRVGKLSAIFKFCATKEKPEERNENLLFFLRPRTRTVIFFSSFQSVRGKRKHIAYRYICITNSW